MDPAPSNDPRRPDLLTWIWRVSLLAVIYFVAGLFGFLFSNYYDSVTLIWPGTGLSLAALILFGRKLWPGIFVGALMLALSGPGPHWMASIGISIGNTLEALIGATLLRAADFRPNLQRPRDGLALLLFGVFGCTIVSATIGITSYYLSGYLEAAELGLAWLNWWVGDASGALLLTPFLLMLLHGTPSWASLVRRPESWFMLTALLVTNAFVFLGPDLGRFGIVASLSSFPLLVWAGTRLGQRGAVVASSFTIAIAIFATAVGSGPTGLGTRDEAIFLLWSYAIFIGVSGLALAAVVGRRDAANLKYRSEEAERLRIEKHKLLLLERERLTRELHDGLGGQLVSVLSMVERGLAEPSEVAESLRRAIDDIGIVIDSLDANVTDLSTSLGKLRARLAPLLRRNGIELNWYVDIPDLGEFPPEAAIHVLRIIQEAVTNTLRHADADSVEVRISCLGVAQRQLHVAVRDDGRGLPTPMSSGGRGIKNMKARAAELGAALRVENTSSGTQIELTVPIQN